MSTESSQKWLERNRPPRVQISYDVETGGASAKRELPMVVGILADLGAASDPLPKRRFIEIDRDNFDQVMKTIAPTLQIKGIDGLSGSVTFEKLDHFEPDYLVKHVKGLDELFSQRQQLRDLMAKIDGNDRLHRRLAEAVKEDPTFATWGVKLGEPAPASRPALAKLQPADVAALAPAALAAYSDEELGAMTAEQLAALTAAQAEALKERKLFSKDQIAPLADALKAVLQPKD
jgi:type VI secretion system protein ImpB